MTEIRHYGKKNYKAYSAICLIKELNKREENLKKQITLMYKVCYNVC